jgi:hypothetical protein
LHGLKKSKQPLVFFKFDFSNAYDKVYWSFLFVCMDKFEIPTKFVMKVFFQAASANIEMNEIAFKALVMECGKDALLLLTYF